jgi:hypothetical protein
MVELRDGVKLQGSCQATMCVLSIHPIEMRAPVQCGSVWIHSGTALIAIGLNKAD